MKRCIIILLTASAVSGFSNSRSFQIRNSVALSAALGSSEPSSSALNAATVTEDATSSSQDVEAAPKKLSYLDDGFVFGLEDSGLERTKGKASQVVLEGDSLETQWWQVAMVSGTFLGHAGFAANALSDMLQLNGGDVLFTTVQAIALLMSSWIIADLGSGVLHFSVDNYGNGRTPIMGGIIAAFQGHHSAQWTITERGFCNNVYKLCIPFGVAPMTFINLISGPFVTLFFTIFCVMEIMSQEFHKWSHMTKGECPAWINWLQSAGLSIDRKRHAQHHLLPYSGNYCIVSGINNQWLDQSGIFRRLEHVIYKLNGVESNSWKLDPDLKEKTLRGEYKLQK
jgi:ubiquitin-conjugating enzyme E2 variant